MNNTNFYAENTAGKCDMKISSRGRYALASMILLAQNECYENLLSVIGISGSLAVSKIYLEQVFSLLRMSGLVTSSKGSHGGYKLSRPAEKISAYDILSVTETALFGDTDETVALSQPAMERALQDVLYKPADKVFKEYFERIPLSVLAEEAFRNSENDGYMYCI
jgi:Rrf2 family protein